MYSTIFHKKKKDTENHYVLPAYINGFIITNKKSHFPFEAERIHIILPFL